MLSAFADRAWFCLYRLTPREGGKLDKVPVGVDGRNSNAQDPATWMLPIFAEAYAGALGCGTGIVLHPGCQLACIDLDHCVSPTGEITVFAQTIIAMFPGAFVELSVSGTGVHIFFSYTGDLERHGTRGDGIEVYTTGRFVALGTQGQGDPRSDHTAMLHVVLATLVNQPAPAQASAEWTDGPDPAFRGGGTDEQVIATIRAQVVPRGTGASGRALWDCDVDALALAYPPGRSGEAYNASAADQGLANMLARETGYDCERMARLLVQSGLARDKHEREDYIRRTVLRACDSLEKSREKWRQRYGTEIFESPHAESLRQHASIVGATQQSVGGAQPVPNTPAIIDAAEPKTVAVPATRPAPGSYHPVAEMVGLWEGYVWLEDCKRILAPDGNLLDKEMMDTRFGGCSFQMRVDGSKPSESAWDAFRLNPMHRFDQARGLVFEPRMPPAAMIQKEDGVFVNSWLPVAVESKKGDVSLFLRHLKKLLPNDDDALILLCYLAACVQNPGVKFTWAPFIQGVQGNGKSFFSVALQKCFGDRYSLSTRASELGSRFNGKFDRKMMIIVEDVFTKESSDQLWEALKPMITGKRMEIEYKGMNSVERDVCFNFIFNANNAGALKKTADDRRICPLFTAQQKLSDLTRDKMDADSTYFAELYDWAENGGWANIHEYLSSYEIDARYNPAGRCMRAPTTSSTKAAIVESLGPVEQEVIHSVTDGRPGFRDGWINSGTFDHLLNELGRHRTVTRNARHKILDSLGYERHPALPSGRVIAALPDGTRPTLYVLTGHPSASLPAAVASQTYWRAQHPQHNQTA